MMHLKLLVVLAGPTFVLTTLENLLFDLTSVCFLVIAHSIKVLNV
jgi:hypothetical protein